MNVISETYKVVRLLGKGGMSEVYEVENIRIGSRHALKLFAYEQDDVEVRERFVAEGRLLARLNHPRVVKVTDCGTEAVSGRPYFVMNLVLDAQGRPRSLAEVEPGTVDEEEIGRWYDDIREGLAYIHGEGVIHRDLKLQNVMIGPDGHVVLTDFGISKVGVKPETGTKIVDTVNTLVKMREGRSLVMGSVGYMAPELEMGASASAQSDWYALGVIVYRLLTGTWCDARTDLADVLETYDPVWRRLLPKLLHAHPQGRECLSFADERRADRERAQAEAEEREECAKRREGRLRQLCRVLGAGIVLLGVLAATLAIFLVQKNAWMAKRCEGVTFSEVCRLPEDVLQAKTGAAWQRGRAEGALVDAWALTHAVFDDLRQGRITGDKAASVLEGMAAKTESELVGQVTASQGMVLRGDVKVLLKILKNAAVEMRRRVSETDREKR